MKDNIMRKFNAFMMGRYGNDDLTRFLNYMVLVLLALGILVSPFFSNVAFALLIFEYFRIFSKNINARSSENVAFLMLKRKVITKKIISKLDLNKEKPTVFILARIVE